MQYVLPFIVAMVVTMVGLPVLARLANKWLIMDQPGARKVHAVPVPRVGGLAMAMGVTLAALLTIHLQTQDLWFLAGAAVLIIFGVLDDRFDLDYRVKVLGQVLAVSIVVLAGDVRIQTLAFEDRVWLPDWAALPLTAFFLVGITNAINLADGLDGLAGGTTFLCLCAVALLSSVGDPGASTALALAFAGAVLGFLRFNTYPASVFMGDAGSQLLGFTIGVLSVRATQSPTSEISAAIPVLLLALPILDTLSVMVQRMSEGRSPFSADKNHIHHKLLAMGFRHHEAVMVIYVVQFLLFVVAYLVRFESDLLILSIVSLFFFASLTLFQTAQRARWRTRRESAATLQSPALLARISLIAIAFGVGIYASLIVAQAAAVAADFRVLIVALLAVVVGFLAVLRAAPLGIIEKGAVYVTATVLVYVDSTVPASERIVDTVGWLAVSIAALATAARLRLYNDRTFQVTPLDLIVLFMALVVPSLPGTFNLPRGSALAIAKLVVLFYALEMLLSRSEHRAVWIRLSAASILAGLAMRPFVPL